MKMLAGNRSRFIVRTLLPTLLTIGLFITAFFIVLIPQFEEIIYGREREMIRELTNSAWSILEYWHQREENGKLTREEAQQSAIRQIEQLRYGEEGKDYFWITDHVPTMIMHPYRPDLNRSSLVTFEDSFGKRLFVEMVATVERTQEGFVDYTWQWKDDSTRVVPKLSFVKGFAPWGWIIGTGIYLEDAKLEIAMLEGRILGISIGITIAIALLLLFIALQNLKAENQRQRAEQELHESREKYRALVETSTEGLIMVLADQETFWNKTLSTMLGLSETPPADPHFRDLFLTIPHAETFDFERFTPIAGRESKNEQVEATMRTRSGDTLNVLISLSPITLLNREGIVLNIKDVSRHKQIEDELGISQEKYHTLTNQLSIGVFRATPTKKGEFLEVNPAAETILGTTGRESLLACSLLEFFEDPHEGKRFFEALFEAGIVRNWIAGIRRRTGSTAIISLSALLLRDKEGNPLTCDGVMEDITEQKRTDQERESLLADLQSSIILLGQPVKPYSESYPACRMPATVGDGVRLMTQWKRDAVLVSTADGTGIGIVTDRDIRERVLANELGTGSPLHAAMTAPLITLPPAASVLDALQLFSEKQISHIVVMQADGTMQGLVHARHIHQALHSSYLFFLHRIQSLTTVAELREYHTRLMFLVQIIIERGAGIADVTHMTTVIAEGCTQRIIALALMELGPPPVPFAFIALGSEGRKEQTLLTDQDNAIVYGDPETGTGDGAREYFLHLGEKICSALDVVGYRYCRGGIMAKNVQWCQPLAVWRKYFTDWVLGATPKDLLDSKIFFDFRLIHGDEALVRSLRTHLKSLLLRNDPFFLFLSESVLKWELPEGARKLRSPFDIKKVAMPFVDSARLYALKHQIDDTNTMDRLTRLYEANVFSKKWHETITGLYSFLMRTRFQHQAARMAEHLPPGNEIDPADCTELEILMLRKAVEQIDALREKISIDFKGMNTR